MYRTGGSWSFYNGVLKGTTAGYNAEPTTVRDGYKIATGTEGGYQTAYLKERGLEVGDIVTYTPSGTYNVSSTYSGYSSNQSLNSGSSSYQLTTWRVLSIDEESGQVELVPTSATSGYMYLQGANGYNNAVKLLNDACNALYGNSSKGISARSINRDDYEKYMSDAKLTEAHSCNSGKYGTRPYTYTSKKNYPNIYGQEAKRVINGSETASGLGISEQNEWVTGSTTASSSISPYYTYYSVNINSTSAFESATNGVNYKELLVPSTSYWWLASRCVAPSNSNYCRFYVCYVDDGSVDANYVFNSSGSAISRAYGLFPVVSLSSELISGSSSAGFVVQ